MTMRAARRLLEPITLGAVTLPNRIAVSPMCQYSCEDGSAIAWHLQYLGSLSASESVI
jgi:2,4-dienoyl-CoA reductase-like NADH-dependent reductase (Old Yellow Enzyme family)